MIGRITVETQQTDIYKD